MTLSQAIVEAAMYVKSHPDFMTETEMVEFHRLAQDVYTLAYPLGLTSAFPQLADMKPRLERDDMNLPPVQIESKLNLPGDWTMLDTDNEGNPLSPDGQPVRAFLVAPPPRWFEDIETLLALAQLAELNEPKPTAADAEKPRAAKRTGRPRKDETDKDALVVLALIAHHQYEAGGSIGNWEPASVRGLVEAFNSHAKAGNEKISTAAVSRFLKAKLGGHKRYSIKCHKQEIGDKLSEWQNEESEGHAELRPEWHAGSSDESDD